MLSTGPAPQSFQLITASDSFLDPLDSEEPCNAVGKVTIDAANQTISLDGTHIKHAYWNTASNGVAWACSDSRIPEGNLSFNNEGNSLVGMLSYSSGERVIVTGEPTEPPPSYESVAPMVVDGLQDVEAKGSGTFSFGPAVHPPVDFLEKPVAHGLMAASFTSQLFENNKPVDTEEVMVTVYQTKRLLVKDKQGNPFEDEDWDPYYNLSYGVVPNDDLALVVFLGSDDISDVVNSEHGREMTLFKSEGDPEKKERDYTFRIVINPGIKEHERTFEGTFVDKKGEWKWKGEFFVDQKRKRSKSPAIEHGPDGKTTRQQLLMISSINAKGLDIAQQEGDRIFGKLLLASIPQDVKSKLYPDAPTLDKDEQAIANLAPDYLPQAAVVNILQHFSNSDSVAPAQRARINRTKCEAFFPACMSAEKPLGNQVDPVEAYGWDRKNDADRIERVQTQSRAVALQCYRLGYVRAVASFQPYLQHAAYWYKRLVEYLDSPTHLRQFTHRVRSQDDRVERDVYDWHNKLTLLHSVCGDQEGVSNIEDVMSALQGASTLATLDSVEWNDEFTAHLKEFFESMDQVHNDPLKSKDESYAKLQKLMGEREAHTWAELGKDLIHVVQAHSNFLHRKPTVTELSAILARKQELKQLTGLPKYWEKFKAGAPSAIVTVGMFVLQQRVGAGNLSVSERISMYLSLVQGMMMAPKAHLAGPLQLAGWVIKSLARGVGWCLKKLMPRKSLGLINAAKALSTKVNNIGMAIKGLWATFGKGVKLVFGFFVSCFCVWAAADEWISSITNPAARAVDRWFSGLELLLTSLQCITLAVQIGVAIWGTGEVAIKVVAFCGSLGMALMAIGTVLMIVALIVTAALKEDPVRDFIDKYGGKYGLLKPKP